jgi:hypothetical protein
VASGLLAAPRSVRGAPPRAGLTHPAGSDPPVRPASSAMTCEPLRPSGMPLRAGRGLPVAAAPPGGGSAATGAVAHLVGARSSLVGSRNPSTGCAPRKWVCRQKRSLRAVHEGLAGDVSLATLTYFSRRSGLLIGVSARSRVGFARFRAEGLIMPPGATFGGPAPCAAPRARSIGRLKAVLQGLISGVRVPRNASRNRAPSLWRALRTWQGNSGRPGGRVGPPGRIETGHYPVVPIRSRRSPTEQ